MTDGMHRRRVGADPPDSRRRRDPRVFPLFDGRSFALLPLLMVASAALLVVCIWTLLPQDEAMMWNERQAQGLLRWLAIGMLAMAACATWLAWQGVPWLPRRVSQFSVLGLAAMLAILAMFIGSGQLQELLASRVEPARPPLPTREQVFHADKASLAGQLPEYAADPAAPAWFEGAWRRDGQVWRSDLRRIRIRLVDGEFRVTVWYQCGTELPCAAAEAVAQATRTADGRVVDLGAELPVDDGVLWFRMAPGRRPAGSAAIVTKVMLHVRPEAFVSSGGPKAMRREPAALPIEHYRGDWARSFPPPVGALTRISIREGSERQWLLRAWNRCDDLRECDIGETVIEAVPEPGGGGWLARFSRENSDIRLHLDPPADGVLPTVTEIVTAKVSELRDSRSGRTRSSVERQHEVNAVSMQRGHDVDFGRMFAGGNRVVATARNHPPALPCSAATSLHQAVAGACPDQMRRMLAADRSARDGRDRYGRTPLALAALLGRHDAARALLAAGAGTEEAIRFAEGDHPGGGGAEAAQHPELVRGSTPLMLASDAAMVDLLLKAGARSDVKNAYGWSAIFVFTHHGSAEMLERLLAGGARADDTADYDPSHRGSTPLMWAAYMNRLPQLRLLLAHGARSDIRDGAGKTALDYARQFGHAEAKRMLEAAAR